MATGGQNTQTIQLPLDGGMDQRQHPRQLAGPATIEATNVRFPRIGAIDKRPGTNPIGGPWVGGYTMIPGAGRILAFRDELLITDTHRIASLSVSGGQDRFIDKGKVPEAVSSSHVLDTTQYFVSQPDVAYTSDGLIIHVWAGNDRSTSGSPAYDIFWTVEDAMTGAEIVSSQFLTVNGFAFELPKIVAVGPNAMVFVLNTTNILALLWNPTTLKFNSLGTIHSGTAGSGLACCTDGTNAYLVYPRTANIISVDRYNPVTGALINTIDCSEAVAPTVATGFSICAPAGEPVWISYARITSPVGTSVTVRSANFAHDLSSQTTAPWTVYSLTGADFATTGIARLSATTAIVLIGMVVAVGSIDASASFMAAPVISNTGAIVGNATGDNRKTFWAQPGSMPFIASTTPLRAYAWAYVGGTWLGASAPVPPQQSAQYTFMLVDLMADDTTTVPYMARPITWQSPRFAIPDSPPFQPGTDNGLSFFTPPAVAQLPNDKWLTSCIIRRNAATRLGLAAITARFGGPDRFISTELGRTSVVTPGFFWDRSGLTEISYAYWPQGIDLRSPNGPSATGGKLANAADYAYRVLYEWVDSTGAVHRSQPSDFVSVHIPGTTGNFTGSCSFKVPCLTITMKQGPSDDDIVTGVRVVVYRAILTGPTANIFFRVFSDSATPLNRPRQATITITDTAADQTTTITAPEFHVQPDTIYTAGGVISNVMPAGFTSCVTYLNRVWVASGNTVSYSKAFVTGEAVSFTDAFDLPLEESGDITALWVMDDTLYISTQARIYYLQAYGPNDTGAANDVNIPNRVATDLGVVDQRSIVVTPLGTIYQSPVGMQVMDRGRSVSAEPIGARVRNELAAYPEVTSAIVHPSGRYVSFCARNPVPTSGAFTGVRLIFDYATNRWSRDTMLNGDPNSGAGLYGEAVSRGQVYMMSAAGSATLIHRESSTTYLDEETWVPMAIDLAEIHPSGLQGWLGFEKWTLNNERFTDHDLSMSWWYNYAASPFETRGWTSAQLPVDEQISHNPSIHKASSMRMRIVDGAPSGAGGVVGIGRGSAWIGLAVEIDPIDNKTMRLPAAQKG